MKLFNWPQSSSKEDLQPKEFIEYYSNSYYISKQTREGEVFYKKIKNANQSSEYIEKDIERILWNGIESKIDVFHILAWKIGGIDHKASQSESKANNKATYIYQPLDKNGNRWNESFSDLIAIHWGSKIPNIEKLIDYIYCKKDEWYQLSFEHCDDAEQVLWDLKCCLMRNQIKCFGSVYLVTLLYFISKGHFPIYDRQVAKALNAINNEEIKIDERIEISPLPSIENPEFWNKYCNYIDALKSLCKNIYGENETERYQTDRDVDRALWVYGHLFR